MGLGIVALMGLLILKNRKKSFEFGRIAVFFLVVMLMPFDLVGWLLLGWLLAGRWIEKKRVNMMFKVGEKKGLM